MVDFGAQLKPLQSSITPQFGPQVRCKWQSLLKSWMT